MSITNLLSGGLETHGHVSGEEMYHITPHGLRRELDGRDGSTDAIPHQQPQTSYSTEEIVGQLLLSGLPFAMSLQQNILLVTTSIHAVWGLRRLGYLPKICIVAPRRIAPFLLLQERGVSSLVGIFPTDLQDDPPHDAIVIDLGPRALDLSYEVRDWCDRLFPRTQRVFLRSLF
jgi:hypothetical protein